MTFDFTERTQLLIGDAGLAKLAASRVLVLGLGGVGAYCAEMLCRAGVGHMTIIDGDIVASSNRNRQLPALSSTLGRPKVEVVAERLRDINPELELVSRNEFLAGEAIDQLLRENHFDCAADAIDSLEAKVHFIAVCVALHIPLASSMGAGGRRNPELVRSADIGKTFGCALARAVRKKLSLLGIKRGVRTIFSPEIPPPGAILPGEHRSLIGSISYLPAVFGCHLAAAVLDQLLSAETSESPSSAGVAAASPTSSSKD